MRRGEVFGFLGPSGAGNSTVQKILIGLIRNYQGSVQICGLESKTYHKSYYENIGVDFEFSSLYEKLTARENLDYFSSLYEKPLRSIDSLLELVNLKGDMNKKVSCYSKGMRSRLNFIKALIHNPTILFLDEPTSGLDPSNCRRMKDIILSEKNKGKAVVLRTHNMEDAKELCNRVAFIVDGQIKVIDSPKNLIMSRRNNHVLYTYIDSDCYDKQRESKLTKLGG